MKQYRVAKPITLHSGVIGLTDKQAAGRGHSLALRPDGLYTITGSPVQFCAGEIILLDPEQIMPVAHLLVDLDPAVTTPVAEAAAKPARKAAVRKKAQGPGKGKGKG